jgi:transcriptional regulator with XRE-family HTH domain
MSKTFGSYIRQRRSELQSKGPDFSVRRLARRIGVEPSYLSKVERDETPPPSEAKILALAEALGEDADVLLAMAGKVSSELQAIIRDRPRLWAQMIRDLKSVPEKRVRQIAKKVRDGNW